MPTASQPPIIHPSSGHVYNPEKPLSRPVSIDKSNAATKQKYSHCWSNMRNFQCPGDTRHVTMVYPHEADLPPQTDHVSNPQ